MAEVDSDDIYREINEDNADECLREIQRLWNKRRGFKAYFTQCINNLAALIQAARGGADGNLLDSSLGTREALQRQREKLETILNRMRWMDRHHFGSNLTLQTATVSESQSGCIPNLIHVLPSGMGGCNNSCRP